MLIDAAPMVSGPLKGVRFTVPINPLAFTYRLYRTERRARISKVFQAGNKFIATLKTMENAGDADGRAKCSCVLQTAPPVRPKARR